MALEVLYEDNHIIAVNKKPGELVQGDKTGDPILPDAVKAYLKKKYNKPGNVFCGVTHRLDRPTSGVVLFARTSKALSRLNEMFKKHAHKKTYWAMVEGKPKSAEGKLCHHLIKNQEKNKSRAFDQPRNNAKEARLTYATVKTLDRYTLLQVDLETGRHHQIRCQLAHIGHPIKGDVKYGARRSNFDASIHLHARKIAFEHPVSKEQISITAPPPNEALWNAIHK